MSASDRRVGTLKRSVPQRVDNAVNPLAPDKRQMDILERLTKMIGVSVEFRRLKREFYVFEHRYGANIPLSLSGWFFDLDNWAVHESIGGQFTFSVTRPVRHMDDVQSIPICIREFEFFSDFDGANNAYENGLKSPLIERSAFHDFYIFAVDARSLSDIKRIFGKDLGKKSFPVRLVRSSMADMFAPLPQ